MKLKWVRGYKNDLAVVETNMIIGKARVLIEMGYLRHSVAWQPLMDQYVALVGLSQREVIGVAHTIEDAMNIMKKYKESMS